MIEKLQTHKHDCHLELHCANDTTLNKETMHSKAVMNSHHNTVTTIGHIMLPRGYPQT